MSQPHSRPDNPQVWFITGASSGIGLELTKAAIGGGHFVMATARNPDEISEVVALAPERARAARLDVTDAESIGAAVSLAVQLFGRIDVVVNNAGYAALGAFEELSEEEFIDNFTTNVFGAMAVTRSVLPTLRRQGAGFIVQVSSMNGVAPAAGATSYSGTKFALEGISEALAHELAEFGIRVMIAEPGPFRTDFSGRSARWAKPMAEYAQLMDPIRRGFESVHGHQRGDPCRAAEAIMTAIELDHPPLRLPLGTEAFTGIREYLQSRLGELDHLQQTVADTAFR